MLVRSAILSNLLFLNHIKKASNNDFTLREIFGEPGRTWTYDRTIMSPCKVYFTGFHQVILSNIYNILSLLITYSKYYWIVLNIRADKHLYGHLKITPFSTWPNWVPRWWWHCIDEKPKWSCVLRWTWWWSDRSLLASDYWSHSASSRGK